MLSILPVDTQLEQVRVVGGGEEWKSEKKVKDRAGREEVFGITCAI